MSKTFKYSVDNYSSNFPSGALILARQAGLGVNAALLYMVLCHHCFRERLSCWPSTEQLMNATMLSRSSVVRARQDLVKFGLIERMEGRRSVTHVIVHKFVHEQAQGVTTAVPRGVTTDTPGVSPETSLGVSPVTPEQGTKKQIQKKSYKGTGTSSFRHTGDRHGSSNGNGGNGGNGGKDLDGLIEGLVKRP